MGSSRALGWTVVAVAACGEVALTDPDASAPGPNAPARASVCGENASNRVFWSPVVGATEYRIYVSTSSGVTANSTHLGTVDQPPFVHEDVTVGTTYYYRITAVVNGVESSELSNEVSAIPRAYTLPSNVLYSVHNGPNMSTGEIVMWDGWTSGAGSQPDRVLSDPPMNAITKLNSPRTGSIFVDRQGALLYVANAGTTTLPGARITVYRDAATLAGAAAPLHVIEGPELLALRGIWVDTSRNLLYVADRGGSGKPAAIVVYGDACNATGNPTPRGVFSGGGNVLNPTQIVLDEIHDELYIANYNTILVFADASETIGLSTRPPDRIIQLEDASGVELSMQSFGVSLDAQRDILYVTHEGQAPSPPAVPAASVYAIDGAHSLNGRVMVSRTIAGVDSMTLPVAAHVAGNRLFVVNNNGGVNTINSWGNAATLSGNPAATKTPASAATSAFATVFYVP
ncbi:MAG: hypothetical protein AB7P03_09345 [Kofleriaceae bacterium]